MVFPSCCGAYRRKRREDEWGGWGRQRAPSPHSDAIKPSLPGKMEKLSRGKPQIQSNSPSFQTTSPPNRPKIFGRFYSQTWYPDNRKLKRKSRSFERLFLSLK